VLTLQRLALALHLSPTALLRLFVGTPQGGGAAQVCHVSPHDARDAMAFLADVTVPDHSVMLPGERFTKIWAIQNVGDIAWPARHLVRQDEALVVARREHSGALTPLLDAHLGSLGRVLSLPPVPVGQVLELCVDFVAPQDSCTVASIWRLETPSGQPCYPDRAFVQVIVTVVGG
jgi:Ig-like domain from next to BRCA1 gene